MRRNFIRLLKFFFQCVIFVLALLQLWRFRPGNLTTRQEPSYNKSFIDSNRYKEPTKNVIRSSTDVFANITTHKVDDFIEQERNMEVRLKAVQDKCQTLSQMSEWKEIKPHAMVMNYENLHYCYVPKIGCTYWKRLFRFLSGDYPQNSNIHGPWDIDRYFTHYVWPKNIIFFPVGDEERAKNISNKAFMFVRDPYSRLWSAYLDKFVLPDFWNNGGLVGKKDGGCLKDWTFKEFLTTITEIWPKRLEDHWEPIYLMCNPCHIQFAVIGKMEDFAKDVDFVFRKFDIRLDMNLSRKEVVFEEIKSIAKYNFLIEQIKFKANNDCFFKMDVARRLWKVFQYNGYIDRHIPFPAEEFEASNFTEHPTETFTNIATKTIDHQTEDIKSQKRNMMLEAYAEIPDDLMAKIANMYKYDFELFGYDKELFKRN